MDNYLIHHGIKGQKWGIRRYQNEDGTYTTEGKRRRIAENYSEDQRKRDKRVYGRSGVRRINKHMLNGESISSARSAEADRINSTRRAATVGGQIGTTIGGVAGFLGGNAVAKALSTKIPTLADPTVQLIVSGGAATVATQLGRYGGRSAAMLAGGYSPSKYR